MNSYEATPVTNARKFFPLASTSLLMVLPLFILAACCDDRGSDGIVRSVVFIELELAPDKREFRDLHAEIYVDGNLVGTVENGSTEMLQLRVGTRTIKISREGFAPVEKKVEILESGTQKFHFTLEEQ